MLKQNTVKKFLLSTVVLSGITIASISVANAQLAQQSVVADPGRADDRISKQRLVPQAGPKINIKAVALQNAPAGAENIKFNFGGLRIDGVSTYTEDELARIYEDRLGQEITLADLYGIANQITLKYRNDGYILTQAIVPPQTIDNGIVDLKIIEGFIDEVMIQGGDAKASELKTITEYASHISTGGALNVANMERQLLLINDLPGLNARSVISPSPNTAGAADLLIILERDPFEAQASIDNYGSRFLGPFQLGGLARLNSALGYNEQITAQIVTAPDAGLELAFGSLGYEQPVGSLGTRLAVRGSITETDPGSSLDQFDVEGLSKTISLQATHPFMRSRNTNILGRLVFDWRNTESKNNIEETRKDRIRAIRAGTQIEFLDRLLGVAVNTIDLEISNGLDILGASDENDANLSRAQGDPSFLKANIQIQRLQRLTRSFNLLLEGRGQLSRDPLLSSEEFGLGGISTVRGYDPSEIVGDDGIAGKVEVQWNSPSRETQIFGFLDSGTVWNQDAPNSNAKRNSLTSTGLGVRVDLPMEANVEFIVAQPMNEDVASKDSRDPQFFFSLSKKF